MAVASSSASRQTAHPTAQRRCGGLFTSSCGAARTTTKLSTFCLTATTPSVSTFTTRRKTQRSTPGVRLRTHAVNVAAGVVVGLVVAAAAAAVAAEVVTAVAEALLPEARQRAA